MRDFWRTVPGLAGIAIAALLAVAVAATFVQVYRVTHPSREAQAPGDLGMLLSAAEEVRFRAADGTDVAALLFRGRPGEPSIVLGHDLGEGKFSLAGIAIALQNSGFTVLALDFRAHGASGGSRSTLGIEEKRDVIGAVDFLSSVRDADSRRIGAYGVGLGAHAIALAAADRPALKVLVLDGLYPDASYLLVRRVFAGSDFAIRNLGRLPTYLFDAYCRVRCLRDAASKVLPRLVGREILLVAPGADAELAAEMQRLYESVPEQRNADASLVTLPATRIGALYGGEVERYHRRVVDFFEQRLVRSRVPSKP